MVTMTTQPYRKLTIDEREVYALVNELADMRGKCHVAAYKLTPYHLKHVHYVKGSNFQKVVVKSTGEVVRTREYKAFPDLYVPKWYVGGFRGYQFFSKFKQEVKSLMLKYNEQEGVVECVYRPNGYNVNYTMSWKLVEAVPHEHFAKIHSDVFANLISFSARERGNIRNAFTSVELSGKWIPIPR